MMRKRQKANFVKPSSLPTKLAIALSTVMAAPAFAADYPNHEFGLYYRHDLQFNDSDAKDKNKTGDSKKFSANTIRVNFAGDLTDQTSYRIRWRPNRPGDNTDGDKFGSNFDYAYMTHSVNDNFAVRGGKFFWFGHCGREGDYNGQDVYFYSTTCDGPDYNSGIGIMPSFAGQTLVFSVANGDDSEANHANFGYAVTWYGDLAGVVKPIAYYAMHPTTEQKDPTTGVTLANGEATTNTYWGIGARLDLGMAFFEADYITYEKEGRATTNPLDETSTGIVLAARAMLMNGAFQPHLKYVMDDYDDDDSNKASTDSFKHTGISVALEYYPEMFKQNGVDWRVHAVYTAREWDYDQTNKDKLKVNQVLLGFSFNFTDAGPKK